MTDTCIQKFFTKNILQTSLVLQAVKLLCYRVSQWHTVQLGYAGATQRSAES